MVTRLYEFFYNSFYPAYLKFYDFFFNTNVTIGFNSMTLSDFFLGIGLEVLIPIVIAKFVIGIIT